MYTILLQAPKLSGSEACSALHTAWHRDSEKKILHHCILSWRPLQTRWLLEPNRPRENKNEKTLEEASLLSAPEAIVSVSYCVFLFWLLSFLKCNHWIYINYPSIYPSIYISIYLDPYRKQYCSFGTPGHRRQMV